MATSEVDICNSALIHVGAGFISSLEDNSDEARACKQFFAIARDQALVQADWTFATTQAVLSKLTAVPEFGYAYQYTLPTDPYCLKPLFIENPDKGTDWKVHGRKLLTDRDGVELQYIFRQTDVSTFSPVFEIYLGYVLASMIAYAVTGKRSVMVDMRQLAEGYLADAAGIDAQIGEEEGFAAGDIDNVRA